MATTLTAKKQTSRIGQAGSFFNQLRSNNSTLPEVGKGATQMHYTDRTCFEVIEVSKDGKTVKLEHLNAIADMTKDRHQGHQNWILEPTGRFTEIKWMHGSWKEKSESVIFTEEYSKKIGRDFWGSEDWKKVHDDNGELHVVEGITEKVVKWNKIRILFGSKDYYYDWSF